MPEPTIEEATTREQLALWTEMRNRIDSRNETTVDETVFFTALETGRVNLLARLDGVAVGVAHAAPQKEQPDSPYGELVPRVLPEARRQGVGSALLQAGAAVLRRHGKSGGQASVAADCLEALEFAANRGFLEVSRSQTVVLDLERFEHEGRRPPEGVELTDLAARPDLMRSLWELDALVSRDIPGPDSEFAMPFEDYPALFEKPGLDRRLFILAVAGEQVIGVAMLVPTTARPEIAFHWLTGVHPDWRGRGLASTLKDFQLARAKAFGIRRVRTTNELRNAPIRRLNERLGYTSEPDSIVLRGPLPDPA
jgi:mycothiol synthase